MQKTREGIEIVQKRMTRINNNQNNSIVTAIRQAITDAKRVLVTSHIRPDGDAVGSLLGLGHALLTAGKDVQMVLQDGVPHNLGHLPGSEHVSRKPNGAVDLIIVVDVSDLPRLGNVLEGYGKPDINIDHHFTNVGFADINLVEYEAVATAEIIARCLTSFGLAMSEAVANSLLTGMITDTIGFRTANITPSSMRVVVDLMEAGGSLSAMYYPALVQRTYAGVKYWGAGLSKLQRQDRLVWTYLSLDDRHRAGYLGNDDADLINTLSAIEDVDVAIIVVEQSPSRVKISWRQSGQSLNNVDVSRIASKFGGGGHKAAAGAEINGTLVDVLKTVVEVTHDYLANHEIMP